MEDLVRVRVKIAMKEVLKNNEPDAALWRRQRTLEPSEAQIRERAYRLYLERGARHGQDRADWLEAERELRRLFVN
jgi:hypothetical protein